MKKNVIVIFVLIASFGLKSQESFVVNNPTDLEPTLRVLHTPFGSGSNREGARITVGSSDPREAGSSQVGLRIDVLNANHDQVGLWVNAEGGSDYNHAAIFQNGKVGIGTTQPRALLDVAGSVSSGLSTVFGRLPEGDGAGDGTFLGVKSYYTQGDQNVGIKSFAIEHSFYGQINSSINFYRGGGVLGGFITFNTSNNIEKMRITSGGLVGIGTTTPDADALLTVKGNINSREVKVSAIAGGADFVFSQNYPLQTIEEVEAYIKENKHLPEIQSASEMEKNGIELGTMNIKLLQKVEELTLYLIEQNKTLKAQGETLKSYSEALKSQQQEIQELKIEMDGLKAKN